VRSLAIRRSEDGRDARRHVWQQTDKDTKMAIISALGNQNNDTGLVTLARKETKDLELKREIVRRLAEMSRTSKVAADYLLEVIK
jgi:hypothetical protein